WQEGVSMRSLGDYAVEALGEAGLLRMNEFGAMMTRTFAENYPMTRYYKPRIRPDEGRLAWLRILDGLEGGTLDARAALIFTLGLLWRNTEAFSASVDVLMNCLRDALPNFIWEDALRILQEHFAISEAPARLLEVAMHSLKQAEEDLQLPLAGDLKELMQ